MDKKSRLTALISHYASGKPTLFARYIDVAPSTISSWLHRNTFDYDYLFSKCKDVSGEWLLSGKGEMLKTNKRKVDEKNAIAQLADKIALQEKDKKAKSIPLVNVQAVAGFGNGQFAIMEDDVKAYYVIPKFRYLNVDFMIEVSGDSMQPHYMPGDIVACSILRNSGFLQWNRCHVIATMEQGILIKRLMPGNDEQCLKIVSDNPTYPPVLVPKDEITGIAIVVGRVSIE